MERKREGRRDESEGKGFCSDNVSARPDDHTLAESEGVDVHPVSLPQLHPRSISNALIAPLPQMMLIIVRCEMNLLLNLEDWKSGDWQGEEETTRMTISFM